MSGKYDQYIHNPPHLRLSLKADKSVVFDGLMIGHQQLGYGFTIGHQFVRSPLRGIIPVTPTISGSFWPGTVEIRTTRMISGERWFSILVKSWKSMSSPAPR